MYWFLTEMILAVLQAKSFMKSLVLWWVGYGHCHFLGKVRVADNFSCKSATVYKLLGSSLWRCQLHIVHIVNSSLASTIIHDVIAVYLNRDQKLFSSIMWYNIVHLQVFFFKFCEMFEEVVVVEWAHITVHNAPTLTCVLTLFYTVTLF